MDLFKKRPKRFFTPQQEAEIVAAIKSAELNTSGEIKVHVESHCEDHPFERGVEAFSLLELDDTQQRNGVLFYLALKDHKFAIIADIGINEEVGEDFWEGIKQGMRQDFAAGQVSRGLAKGISATGEALKSHFPCQDDDENEISDEISKGR